MCNKIHRDQTFQEIPEEGKGWKLFQIGSRYTIRPLCDGGKKYCKDDLGWVNWKDIYDIDTYGFCFFTDLEEAKRCAMSFGGPLILVPINYEKGLGSHIERESMCGAFKISIAKRFSLDKTGLPWIRLLSKAYYKPNWEEIDEPTIETLNF